MIHVLSFMNVDLWSGGKAVNQNTATEPSAFISKLGRITNINLWVNIL